MTGNEGGEKNCDLDLRMLQFMVNTLSSKPTGPPTLCIFGPLAILDKISQIGLRFFIG